MLKRENDFEKDKQMEEIEQKYNIGELFNEIVLKGQEQEEEKKEENE